MKCKWFGLSEALATASFSEIAEFIAILGKGDEKGEMFIIRMLCRTLGHQGFGIHPEICCRSTVTIRDAASPPRFKRHVATVLGPMDGGQGALGTFIDAFRLVWKRWSGHVAVGEAGPWPTCQRTCSWNGGHKFVEYKLTETRSGINCEKSGHHDLPMGTTLAVCYRRCCLHCSCATKISEVGPRVRSADCCSPAIERCIHCVAWLVILQRVYGCSINYGCTRLAWQVLKEGGGNICCENSGLAVMLVTPPFGVANCDQLCLMAVHPGHYPIESGSEIVEDVCGSVRTRCAIALGDWNVDAAGVMGGPFNSWERLVGGNPPVFVVPNSETCCHPSTCCRFDHLATNIPGALPVHVKVWEYQLFDQFRMDEEHMPVTVHFTVPQDVGQV